ncbi:hypothetical protein A2881_03245 [Candidatus Peribacteria bacterium RIFCSPHIGHO2_01_FULL_55_13]|nr:MAG: hypothetical protein A2881_03245 [Candidatus Peribacteria bacterium RIFCSPHIGHO2_01_FULL_55_13]OGJ64094.1 MAG: hypothetical protein A3F36_03650 [Candidatus Peribacteria bacterium RIFCSPHIGHO2_12_FULL_55_11]
MSGGNTIRANWKHAGDGLELPDVARTIGSMGQNWGEFHSVDSDVEVTLNAEGEKNRQTIEDLLERAGCVIQ